jgi:hypothetical protein
LQSLIWPGEVERLEVAVLEVGEPVAGQLSLFAENLEGIAGGGAAVAPPLAELAHRWMGRYGRVFFCGQICDASHPVPERVYHLQAV